MERDLISDLRLEIIYIRFCTISQFPFVYQGRMTDDG
jgi:hypothetical protein